MAQLGNLIVNGTARVVGPLTASKLNGDISSATGMTSSQVTTALGFTPQATSTNLNSVTSSGVTFTKSTSGSDTLLTVSF